jgi:hypothetical protein
MPYVAFDLVLSRGLAVGLGNTAADTSTSLVGHADKIMLHIVEGRKL